ncbi:TonB-dependent receptor [Formosa sp. PL04]|uniref:TonB-dependent receptor n=1 Tax=Formosa sp. PL04 TaxID=3081755 RepID=UPI00298137A4|nr:TonB-dependent receptor [Formosa sp. PL04]MDW5288834.1 TonB-dependent receptor [Formosa sp. PL04]
MYKQFKYILTTLVFLSSATLMFSQEKDTIQTDVISVVKPYTPTISDAFKVKTNPALEDNLSSDKKVIEYEILSVPVASTFIPTKGKAALVEREKPELFFENYLTLGFGSYGTLRSELYITKEIDRIGSFGARLAFDKANAFDPDSDPEPLDQILDNSYSNFNLEMEYIKRQRDITWSIKGGLERQKFNWYGVGDSSVPNNTDVLHNYYDLYFIGDLAFDYTYVKSASLTLRRFYDDFDSGESHLKFTGRVDLPIMDEEIHTDVRLEYFNGHAGASYAKGGTIPDYGNLLLGISPSYELRRDDFTLNVGASIYYMVGMNSTESNFYAYPNITGSYRIVDDAVIAYGGLTGDVIQNTYREFAHTNQFLSPTINVKPTDNNLNAYAGMLGKFTNSIGYNVKVGYTSEKDKSLFRKNTTNEGERVYKHGNSFTVVYDDIKTIHALGELTMDMNKNLKMGLRAEYMSYNTEFQEEAWNLPNIKASVFGDYLSDSKWFAGANIFYVGERKDQDISSVGTITSTEIIDIDGYIDLNLNGGYNFNNRITVFLKLNNIAGQNYDRWDNYYVQGFQVLGGATYKFDF